MRKQIHDITKQLSSAKGQTMAEYAVILGLIVLVTVVTFTQLGDSIAVAINGVRAVFP